MTTAIELLRQGRRDEIWRKYCGFIDLSLEEFMEIQEELLMEQIQLLSRCELGRKIMGDRVPTSVKEFRKVVPLTTYEPYAPYLLNKREDALPRKPYCWTCTSGRSGEYERKWVPYTKEIYTGFTAYILAAFIFGSADRRRDFLLEEGDTLLYTLAPPPYASGTAAPGVLGHFPLKYIPPLEEMEGMEFQERIEKGFQLALKGGLDLFYGLASVLVKIGEQFEQGASSLDLSSLLHPRVMARVINGLVKSKLAHRATLPRDLWSVKAIMAGGTDVALYRDDIERYWGKRPVELYGGTEFLVVALQTWGDSLTFVPDMSFLEFIPEKEHLKSKQDPDYQPCTVLLNEISAGGVYEVVATNFHGGAFVRYRPNDLIQITALRDDELGIDIPQMVFYSRADDVIDIAGFARLMERTIAQALHNAAIRGEGWMMAKEVREGQPGLRLYIELSEDELKSEEEIAEAVHQNLKDLDPPYRDLETLLELKPLRVTRLSPNTFQGYFLEKQMAGADLAHLKPPRMKPSERIIRDVLRLSAQGEKG